MATTQLRGKVDLAASRAVKLCRIARRPALWAALRDAASLIAERHASFLVEFMSDELLAEGRQLLGGYRLTHLADNHWLAEPGP